MVYKGLKLDLKRKLLKMLKCLRLSKTWHMREMRSVRQELMVYEDIEDVQAR